MALLVSAVGGMGHSALKYDIQDTTSRFASMGGSSVMLHVY